ncbi:putative inactive carboxylesterase 4 [Anopheles darlingi]|uniref:putative inactive carboxylesterase 4 n=1 Tax=Anopheles darlingi TaxID=43151 RepID=UPI0021005854|nr:putative inactive carboxylesterase 4 [Anopheles darlingi]
MRIPKPNFLHSVPLSVCVLFLCFCSTRAQSSAVEPLVCISDGCIRGTTRIDHGNRTYSAYLGIPYAKPPVRELRFANPVPNDLWDGIYDASKEKDICAQKIVTLILGSEDCLYLNVFVPEYNTFDNGGLLPVMLYIHGGSFSRGAAFIATRDPVRLMTTRRVIVVTIQYRLGALGFLSTGDLSAPGNFGMKDQVLAMRWVQRNIRAFRGDPQLITIFGESAGGASVQYHMISRMSRGLFQRAISMSGSALSLWGVPAMISESWFLYPMVGSIKQHLANRKPQPTSVYSFEFKGCQSHSARNTNTTTDYGLTHEDEMIYIFRAPLFFPNDFPVGSPEAEMSRQWIKYLIDFAATRSADEEMFKFWSDYYKTGGSY